MPTIKKITSEEKVEKVDQKKKRVRHTYIFAVGRRKTSIARTRLIKSGEGKITINDKDLAQYFLAPAAQQTIAKPLEISGLRKQVDISIRVAGGGMQGQMIACQHGIARALLVYDSELRAVLKPEGFLKRDPRMKERKKPGLKRARRAPQWQKR